MSHAPWLPLLHARSIDPKIEQATNIKIYILVKANEQNIHRSLQHLFIYLEKNEKEADGKTT